MAGEYIQSDTIADYWKQLKSYYFTRSPNYQEIDKKTYDAIERAEREDSDNHLNFERLGDDTKVVDVAFYKYLPVNQVAFRIHVVNVEGEQETHYFIINSFS